MDSFQYRVFVCTKKRSANNLKGCCCSAGALDIHQAFQEEVERLGLSDRVEVSQSKCLDYCQAGPVAMVYPKGNQLFWLPTKLRIKLKKILLRDRILYGHLTSPDVKAISKSHFINGKTVKQLQISTSK